MIQFQILKEVRYKIFKYVYRPIHYLHYSQIPLQLLTEATAVGGETIFNIL